jgi:hypothetical protein
MERNGEGCQHKHHLFLPKIRRGFLKVFKQLLWSSFLDCQNDGVVVVFVVVVVVVVGPTHPILGLTPRNLEGVHFSNDI